MTNPTEDVEPTAASPESQPTPPDTIDLRTADTKGTAAPRPADPALVTSPDGADRPLGARYVIGAVIGRGAMGRVYRGRIRGGSEDLAIKLLRDDLTEDPELVARFVQERQLLRSIDDPHVVRVHDLIMDGDDLAIVMDYVDGGNLARAVPNPCPPELAADLIAQLADALAAVHAAGIVHRDLKPGNVLCHKDSDGVISIRLTDFGVSRLLSGTLTRVTSLIGTPGYLAPEVTQGRPATPATDVYAMGVMLYELLAGRPPFVADNAHALIRAHNDDPVPRPTGLPEPLWQLLGRMLAKTPDTRPAPAEVAAALRRLAPSLAGTGPFPVPDVGPRPTASPVDVAPHPAVTGVPDISEPVAVEAATEVSRLVGASAGGAAAPSDARRRTALWASGVAASLAVLVGGAWVTHVPPFDTTTTSTAVQPVDSVSASATAKRSPTPSASPAPRPSPTRSSTRARAVDPAPAPAPRPPQPAPAPAPSVKPAPAAPPPATPVLRVYQPTLASRVESNGLAPLQVSSVSTPRGSITSITIKYGKSQPVLPKPGVSSYLVNITGLSNANSYQFTAEVCNSLGRCATSARVTFVPYGWPFIGGFETSSSGRSITIRWAPVLSAGNPNEMGCQFQVDSYPTDPDAPARRSIDLRAGSLTFAGKPGYDYQGRRTCWLLIDPTHPRSNWSHHVVIPKA